MEPASAASFRWLLGATVVDATCHDTHIVVMVRNKKETADLSLTAVWTLQSAATLGSSVRARGILLELRARLSPPTRKSLDISANVLTLAMPENAKDDFRTASAIISKALQGIGG